MLRAILNKSWRQHPTRHQLYGHLPPITKTIKVRRTRHAGHCWRSRDELISDVLLWTPTYGRAKAVRPARTYIQQLCEDTRCSPEDLPEAMNDREEWRERVRDIRASGTTWWWWWWWWLNGCKRVQTPVVLLRRLSDKNTWERDEPPNPPSYGLKTTTAVLLKGWIWRWITREGWYAINNKQYKSCNRKQTIKTK